MAKNEEEDGEIEVLKERVDELEKDINKYMNKKSRKEAHEKSIRRKQNSRYFKILIVLVILLILLDIISVVAYYKPNISSLIKFNSSNNHNNTVGNSNNASGSGKCNDGTPEGTCSKTKPMFCYSGNLVKKASSCGCPAGFVKDFQDCVEA